MLRVIIALLVVWGFAAPVNALAASLTLTWSASTGTVDGYKIERAGTATGTWVQVAQVASSPTSYTDATALIATTYFYRVRAYNTAGDSGYSNVDGGGTLPTLVVTTPSDYQTFTNASTAVAGTASHSSGIQSVTVNGQVATLAGTNWNTTVNLATGTNIIAVIATDSSPSVNSVTQTVHAVLQLAPAQIAVNPSSKSFGTVAVGATAQFSFTVNNTGAVALSGTANVAAPFAIVSGSPFNLAGGASTTVVVSFTPAAAISSSANVSFTSTAGNLTSAVDGMGAILPAAAFSASPTNGTAKLTVTFSDTSTGTITNRFWNFGDGTTLNTTNASVANTYSAPGTNTVTLIVSGPVGVSTNTKPALVRVVYYPPGDVDGSGTVTTNDVRLINEVLTGMRATNDVAFQTTGFSSGDINQDGGVNSTDSLLIKQVLAGLREYVVTEVMPSSRNSTVPTSVLVSGISFPTNNITAVTFGPPINITVSNFTILSDERIQVLVPAGGGLGTGTVNVIASPTNGVTSYGVFINK